MVTSGELSEFKVWMGLGNSETMAMMVVMVMVAEGEATRRLGGNRGD